MGPPKNHTLTIHEHNMVRDGHNYSSSAYINPGAAWLSIATALDFDITRVRFDTFITGPVDHIRHS